MSIPNKWPGKPVHPGKILKEEFMAEHDLTANRLARDLRVPATRIAEIVNERRALTPDTAMRLARYFGVSVEFWMNLQQAYDISVAAGRQKAIEREVIPLAELAHY
jgi:addiction module HigA family antidote